MGTPLNVEGFRHKLATMNSTQDSVQTMALWVTHHRNHSKQIVEVWIQSLRDATKESHRLTLMYLANDVIQNSRRRGSAVFKEAFSAVLEEAASLCRHESIRKSVLRIITIWEERKVLDSDTCEKLQAATVSTRNLKPKVDAQFLAAFNPADVPGAVENLAQFEGEVELKRNQLNNLNLDVASMESISKLKDRAGGKRFSEQFEDGANKLEEFVKSLRKEVEMRKELIELLKKSEIFYEAQSCEAKIVTNAYKNFSTRVGSLKKRLDEYKKHLPSDKGPSPIPSPTVDAPSPGATPPDDPATDKVNTEDMDVSDEEGGIQRGSIMAVVTAKKSKPTQRPQPQPDKSGNLEQLTKLTGASFLTGGLSFKSSARDTPSPTGSNASAPSPENSPSDVDEPYEPGDDIQAQVTETSKKATELANLGNEPAQLHAGIVRQEPEPIKQEVDPIQQDTEAMDAEWLKLEEELELAKAKAAAAPVKRESVPYWPTDQTVSFYGSNTASPIVPYYEEEEEDVTKDLGDGMKDGGGTPLRDEAQGADNLKRVVEEATSNPIGFLSKIINRSQTSNSPARSDSFMSSLSMLAKSVQAPSPAPLKPFANQTMEYPRVQGIYKERETTKRKTKTAKHPFGLGAFLANLSKPQVDSDKESEEAYSPAAYMEDERVPQSSPPVEESVPSPEPVIPDEPKRKMYFEGKVNGGDQRTQKRSMSVETSKTTTSPTVQAVSTKQKAKPPPDPPTEAKAKVLPKFPPGPPPGPPPPDARRGPKGDTTKSESEEEKPGPSMIMYEMASDDSDTEQPSSADQFDPAAFLGQNEQQFSSTAFTSTQSFMGTDLSMSLSYASSSYQNTMSSVSSMGSIPANPVVSNGTFGYEPSAVSTQSISSYNPTPVSSRTSKPGIGASDVHPDGQTTFAPTSASNEGNIPGLGLPTMDTEQPPLPASSYNPTVSYGGTIPGLGLSTMDREQPPPPAVSYNPTVSNAGAIPGLGLSTMDTEQPPPPTASYNPTVTNEGTIPGLGLPTIDADQPPPPTTSYNPAVSNGSNIPGLGMPTMDTEQPPSPTKSYNPTAVTSDTGIPGIGMPVTSEGSIPGIGVPPMVPNQPPPGQASFSSPPTSRRTSIPGIDMPMMYSEPPPAPPSSSYDPTPVSSSSGMPMMFPDQPPVPSSGYTPTPVSSENAISGFGMPTMIPNQPPPVPSFDSSAVSTNANIPGLGIPRFFADQPPPPPPVQSGYNSLTNMSIPSAGTSMSTAPPTVEPYSPPMSTAPGLPTPPIGLQTPPIPPGMPAEMVYQPTPINREGTPGVPPMTPEELPPTSPGYYARQNSDGGMSLPPPEVPVYQPTPISKKAVPPPSPVMTGQAPISPGYYSRQNSDSGIPLPPTVLENMPPPPHLQDNTGYCPPSGSDPRLSSPPPAHGPFPGYSPTEQFPPHQPGIGYGRSGSTEERSPPIGDMNPGFFSPPTSGGIRYPQQIAGGGDMTLHSNAPVGEMDFGSLEGMKPNVGPPQGQEMGDDTPEGQETSDYPTEESTSPISVIRPRNQFQSPPAAKRTRQSSTIQLLGPGSDEDAIEAGEEDPDMWDQGPPMGNRFGEVPYRMPPRIFRGVRPPRGHRFPRPWGPHRTFFGRPDFGPDRWPMMRPRMRFPPRNRPPFGYR